MDGLGFGKVLFWMSLLYIVKLIIDFIDIWNFWTCFLNAFLSWSRAHKYSDVPNRGWGHLFIIWHFLPISPLIKDHHLMILGKISYLDIYSKLSVYYLFSTYSHKRSLFCGDFQKIYKCEVFLLYYYHPSE